MQNNTVRNIGMLIAYLFFMMTYLIRMAPAAMAPEILQEYHYNAFGFSLMSASFYYSYALMQVPAGIMVDRWGCRKILLISILFSAIGLVLQALGGSRLVEDLSRLLLGAASASGSVIMVKLIAKDFSKKYFSMLYAVGLMLSLLGSMLSQTPLALVVDYLGLEHTFLLMAFGCLLLLLGAYVFVGEYDSQAQDVSWTYFYRIFTQRNVWSCGICLGLQSVPMVAFAALWCPEYLQYMFGFDEVLATSYSQVFFICAMVGSLLIGYLADTYMLRKSLLYLSSVLGGVLSVFWLLNMSSFELFLMMFGAIGFVSINVVTTSIVRETMPLASLGIAYGIISTWSQLIGASSQTIFGYLLSSEGSVLHFTKALSLLPLSLLLSLWAIYMIQVNAKPQEANAAL